MQATTVVSYSLSSILAYFFFTIPFLAWHLVSSTLSFSFFALCLSLSLSASLCLSVSLTLYSVQPNHTRPSTSLKRNPESSIPVRSSLALPPNSYSPSFSTCHSLPECFKLKSNSSSSSAAPSSTISYVNQQLSSQPMG